MAADCSTEPLRRSTAGCLKAGAARAAGRVLDGSGRQI